jgi:hypothetical protein
MRLSRVAVPLFCLFVLACATTASAPVPSGPPPDWKLASASMSTGNDFQFVGPAGGQITVRIQGHELNGPQYSLAAGNGFVRGSGAGGAVIDVVIKGDRADGSVRSLPFSCVLTRNPDGSARVTGAMGAGNTDFTISQQGIVGRIGVPTYALTWSAKDDRYEGQPTGAFLQLPAVMATWSDIEVVTVLSILLVN